MKLIQSTLFPIYYYLIRNSERRPNKFCIKIGSNAASV